MNRRSGDRRTEHAQAPSIHNPDETRPQDCRHEQELSAGILCKTRGSSEGIVTRQAGGCRHDPGNGREGDQQ